MVIENKTQNVSVKKFKESKLSKVLLGSAGFSALMCIIAFSNNRILAGITALSQVALFFASWLMGMQIFKEKRPGMRRISSAIAFLLLIPYIAFYNAAGNKNSKFDWAQIELSHLLPQPPSFYGEIHNNSEIKLWIDVDKISQAQYNDYVNACEAKGYTVDNHKADTSYKGFNQDGYKLELSYYGYGSKQEMSVHLDAPMKMQEIQWPTSDVAKLIPAPKSTLGNISWENSTGFMIYIANTPIEDFNEYIKACSDKGFNLNYKKDEDSYSADNETGHHLSIEYLGFNTISIHIESPKEPQQSDADKPADVSGLKASSSEVSVTKGQTLNSEHFSQQEAINNYEKIKYISENESVAKIKFESIENSNSLKVSIEGVGSGETYVYLESEDGSSKSEKIKVTVKEEVVAAKTEEPKKAVVDNTVAKPKGRTVYVTPYGEKYHYSTACAGKNARATDENSAKISHGPCKKCVE